MLERDIENILFDALIRLGVEIRREQIEYGSGGFCRLDNDPMIVYSPELSQRKRIELFLNVLRRLDTSAIYLPPAIRDMIESQGTDSENIDSQDSESS